MRSWEAKHFPAFIQSMNTKYVNGSWRQSNFNTVMLSKKHVAMLVSKNQSERQLNISSKCTFCYSVKKTQSHCHGNDGIFPSIITTCKFSN